MAKGWKRISTVNDNINAETVAQKQRREQNFSVAIQNLETMDLEGLKKHSENIFSAKQAEDAKLLEAFDNKKLKSKAMIKRALQLKKERDAAEKKKAQKQTQ